MRFNERWHNCFLVALILLRLETLLLDLFDSDGQVPNDRDAINKQTVDQLASQFVDTGQFLGHKVVDTVQEEDEGFEMASLMQQPTQRTVKNINQLIQALLPVGQVSISKFCGALF